VYVTYTDGSRVGYASQIVDLTSARLPLKFSTHLAKIGQIQVTLSNVYDHQDLQFAVWSDENGQDDLRWYSAKKTADRTHLADVLLNQHKGV
ncbi:GBS Bsp-like repeat-containing protein, partial [Streptococcus pyogenes]